MSSTLQTIGSVAGKFNAGLGAASSILGLVQFMQDIPGEEVGGTKIQIGVNGEAEDTWDYEGSVRVVWGFDSYNNVLGSSDLDPYGDEGSYVETQIHQYLGEDEGAKYISVMTSTDEVCIQYITATYPSGDKFSFIAGDIGEQCGQSWQPGGTQHGEANGHPYYPKCIWLDTDGGEEIDDPSVPGDEDDDEPISLRQFKVNIEAYMGTENDGKGLDYYCNAVIFSGDSNAPIPNIPSAGHNLDGVSKRAISGNQTSNLYDSQGRLKKHKGQSKKMGERLIVNSRKEQSAQELCDSWNSRSSDMVNTVEGLFCDMSTKTLYPLCDEQKQYGCFDLDEERLQLRKKDSAKLATRGPSMKQYKKFSHYD